MKTRLCVSCSCEMIVPKQSGKKRCALCLKEYNKLQAKEYYHNVKNNGRLNLMKSLKPCKSNAYTEVGDMSHAEAKTLHPAERSVALQYVKQQVQSDMQSLYRAFHVQEARQGSSQEKAHTSNGVGMNMNIELDDDMLDKFVQNQLFEQYHMLKDDFLKGSSIPMYNMDKEMDNELQFNLINAMRLVHNYFALPNDRIKW